MIRHTTCLCVVSLIFLGVSLPHNLYAQEAPPPPLPPESNMIVGEPMLDGRGRLYIDGQQIRLWGLNPLDYDQQCWLQGRAWDCGKRAFWALDHMIAEHVIRCEPQETDADGVLCARCFIKHRTYWRDIGARWVALGWALDKSEESQGAYAENQELARVKRRGIWTSRFQLPDDWRAGIARYYPYEISDQPNPGPRGLHKGHGAPYPAGPLDVYEHFDSIE